MKLIDAEALYEQAAEWEEQALAIVDRLISKPREEMDAYEIAEWRKWSVILTERAAFKHDVADAPIVNAVEVVRCKDCCYYNGNMSYCDIDHYAVSDGYCHSGVRHADA